MSKRHNKRALPPVHAHKQAADAAGVEAFTFGDPVPVLDRRELLDYVECVRMDKWYEPPISFDGLARTFRATVHHSSPLYVKRNILTSTFKPHRLLSQQSFSRFVQDYLVFGNAYLELRTNRLGGPMELKPSLAKYTRRGVDLNTYWFVQYGLGVDPYQFDTDSVFHLLEPDINQEIYGLPEYLSALNSAWLNESATLFRRKYYQNGSHAGFIMYMSDAAASQTDVDNIRNAMKGARGPGNFRNLFMYSPNGKKDGIQIIPLSEVAAKDEFWNIKNVTRDDQLHAHRVPPQLMCIVPENAGGFGNVKEASEVFVRNELIPLQRRMQELNEWIGEDVISFSPYYLNSD